MQKFKKVEEVINAEERAYRYIRNAIITRELRPNEQIAEVWVAKQTELSRTPIRAALKKLNYEGMVIIKPGKGAYVSDPSHKEIRDAYESRMLIETEAVRLACENITDDEINQLEYLVKLGMEYHAHKDYEFFLDINNEFHLIIARASKNQFYEKYIKELSTASNIYLLIYDDFRETELSDMESFKEHSRIIESLRKRDPERCVREMVRHTENTYYTLGLRLKLRTEKLLR